MIRMCTRRTVLALGAVLLATPALAGEKPSEAGQYVDLSPVALPIVVDGRLINYVFVYIRINLTTGANSPRLRELVRLAHRTPFTRYDDYTRIDQGKLKAALFAAAAAIAGPGTIKSIEIVSETPRVRTGLSKPKIAATH